MRLEHELASQFIERLFLRSAFQQKSDFCVDCVGCFLECPNFDVVLQWGPRKSRQLFAPGSFNVSPFALERIGAANLTHFFRKLRHGLSTMQN